MLYGANEGTIAGRRAGEKREGRPTYIEGGAKGFEPGLSYRSKGHFDGIYRVIHPVWE